MFEWRTKFCLHGIKSTQGNWAALGQPVGLGLWTHSVQFSLTKCVCLCALDPLHKNGYGVNDDTHINIQVAQDFR